MGVSHRHAGWSNVSVRDAEWTMSMRITKETINDMDCTLIQKICDAGGVCYQSRRRKKETVAGAAGKRRQAAAGN